MTWLQVPRNQVGSSPFYCKGSCLVGSVCFSFIWVSWRRLELLPGCALCLSSPCCKASRSTVTQCIRIRSPPQLFETKRVEGSTEKAACDFAVLGQKNEHSGMWLCVDTSLVSNTMEGKEQSMRPNSRLCM